MHKHARRLSPEAKQFLVQRQSSYQLAFPPNNLAAQAVLKDLAQFCRASESTFHPDPRAHAVLEGRREVWLRLRAHLDLSPDELVERYGGGKE